MKKIKKNSYPNNDNLEDEFNESYSEIKKWYEQLIEDPTDFKSVTEQVLIELKDEAKKCHDAEVANYNIKNSKTNSDFRWMKTVMSKGTVSDKIAAHTIAIQDNTICNLNTLQNIVNMVKVGKKKECTVVIETLTELFLNDLLKPDKKLKAFHQKPLSLLNELTSGNAVTRRKLLSAWYFEDQLKETYTSYILALNTAAHDSVESNKEKAISAMYKLLAGNPEQEKNLLTYIVNKLGDPSQKVASKAIYCLSQLLFKHSNMQGVVLSEVEKLLFRPNIATRAQYYGLCFLSQFYLSHEASEIAKQLVQLYFSFFKACVKKGEIDSRMMSALLMGVNRAYPYAKLEMDKISEHIDTIYRIVHVANFNVSLHALSLLYQVSDYANNINDRFYSALYKKLLDPHLGNTTHQAILLNLLYKALLKDNDSSRIKVFIKRLLQIALYSQPNFSCGVLYVISQLTNKKKNVQGLILKQVQIKEEEEDDDDDEEKYHDVEETVEVKNEDELEDNSSKLNVVNNLETNEELTEDIKSDVEILNTDNPSGSWYHCNLVKKEKTHTFTTDYNPLNRNPLYAGGEFCAYTELNYLKNHYHPSVALFANQILNGEIIKYSGDPLKDFVLVRFLDRFVFKNPKKLEDISKQGAHPTFGKRKNYKPIGLKSFSVTSDKYIHEKQQNIPVDELFLFKYLRKRNQEHVKKENDDDSDLESVASEEFEEMLHKMPGFKDNDDEELDFMNDVGSNLKKKKKNESEEHSDDDKDEDNDEDLEDDDEELDQDLEDDDDGEDLSDIDDEDKELIDDLNSDDEMSDIVFDSDEDKEVSETDNLKKKTKKKGKNDFNSVFASAEEFASILEDEGNSAVAPGGSNTFANKDNADLKQIAWEEKRNRWLKGFNKAVGGKNKNFKKRPNKNKVNDNVKKRKKF